MDGNVTLRLRYKRRNRIRLNDCIFCNYKLQYPILTKWFAQIRYAFTEHNVGIQHYNKNTNRATQKAEPTKDSAFQNNWRTRHVPTFIRTRHATSIQIRTSFYYPNF